MIGNCRGIFVSDNPAEAFYPWGKHAPIMRKGSPAVPLSPRLSFGMTGRFVRYKSGHTTFIPDQKDAKGNEVLTEYYVSRKDVYFQR